MDSNKDQIFRIFAIFMLHLYLRPATATNINCDGKSFHCVNSTHFMICVDLGGGFSQTVNDFLIKCPPPTVCSEKNNLECTYESQIITESTTLTNDETKDIIITDTEMTTPSSNDTKNTIRNANKTSMSELSNEYFKTIDVTTLPIYEPDVQTYKNKDSGVAVMLNDNEPATTYEASNVLTATTINVNFVASSQSESPGLNSTNYDNSLNTSRTYSNESLNNLNISLTIGKNISEPSFATTSINNIETVSNFSEVPVLSSDPYDTTTKTTTRSLYTLIDQDANTLKAVVTKYTKNTDIVETSLPVNIFTTETTLINPWVEENNYYEYTSLRTENIQTSTHFDQDARKVYEIPLVNSLTSVNPTQVTDVVTLEENVTETDLENADKSNSKNTRIEGRIKFPTEANLIENMPETIQNIDLVRVLSTLESSKTKEVGDSTVSEFSFNGNETVPVTDVLKSKYTTDKMNLTSLDYKSKPANYYENTSPTTENIQTLTQFDQNAHKLYEILQVDPLTSVNPTQVTDSVTPEENVTEIDLKNADRPNSNIIRIGGSTKLPIEGNLIENITEITQSKDLVRVFSTLQSSTTKVVEDSSIVSEFIYDGNETVPVTDVLQSKYATDKMNMTPFDYNSKPENYLTTTSDSKMMEKEQNSVTEKKFISTYANVHISPPDDDLFEESSTIIRDNFNDITTTIDHQTKMPELNFSDPSGQDNKMNISPSHVEYISEVPVLEEISTTHANIPNLSMSSMSSHVDLESLFISSDVSTVSIEPPTEKNKAEEYTTPSTLDVKIILQNENVSQMINIPVHDTNNSFATTSINNIETVSIFSEVPVLSSDPYLIKLSGATYETTTKTTTRSLYTLIDQDANTLKDVVTKYTQNSDVVATSLPVNILTTETTLINPWVEENNYYEYTSLRTENIETSTHFDQDDRKVYEIPLVNSLTSVNPSQVTDIVTPEENVTEADLENADKPNSKSTRIEGSIKLPTEANLIENIPETIQNIDLVRVLSTLESSKIKEVGDSTVSEFSFNGNETVPVTDVLKSKYATDKMNLTSLDYKSKSANYYENTSPTTENIQPSTHFDQDVHKLYEILQVDPLTSVNPTQVTDLVTPEENVTEIDLQNADRPNSNITRIGGRTELPIEGDRIENITEMTQSKDLVRVFSALQSSTTKVVEDSTVSEYIYDGNETVPVTDVLQSKYATDKINMTPFDYNSKPENYLTTTSENEMVEKIQNSVTEKIFISTHANVHISPPDDDLFEGSSTIISDNFNDVTPKLNPSSQSTEVEITETPRNATKYTPLLYTTENPKKESELNLEEQVRRHAEKSVFEKISIPNKRINSLVNTESSLAYVFTRSLPSKFEQATITEPEWTDRKLTTESTTSSFYNTAPYFHTSSQYENPTEKFEHYSTQSHYVVSDIETLKTKQTPSTFHTIDTTLKGSVEDNIKNIYKIRPLNISSIKDSKVTNPGAYDGISNINVNESARTKPDHAGMSIFNRVSEYTLANNEQVIEEHPNSDFDLNFNPTTFSQDEKSRQDDIITTTENKYTIEGTIRNQDVFRDTFRIASQDQNIQTTEKLLSLSPEYLMTTLVPKEDEILPKHTAITKGTITEYYQAADNPNDMIKDPTNNVKNNENTQYANKNYIIENLNNEVVLSNKREDKIQNKETFNDNIRLMLQDQNIVSSKNFSSSTPRYLMTTLVSKEDQILAAHGDITTGVVVENNFPQNQDTHANVNQNDDNATVKIMSNETEAMIQNQEASNDTVKQNLQANNMHSTENTSSTHKPFLASLISQQLQILSTVNQITVGEVTKKYQDIDNQGETIMNATNTTSKNSFVQLQNNQDQKTYTNKNKINSNLTDKVISNDTAVIVQNLKASNGAMRLASQKQNSQILERLLPSTLLPLHNNKTTTTVLTNDYQATDSPNDTVMNTINKRLENSFIRLQNNQDQEMYGNVNHSDVTKKVIDPVHQLWISKVSSGIDDNVGSVNGVQKNVTHLNISDEFINKNQSYLLPENSPVQLNNNNDYVRVNIKINDAKVTNTSMSESKSNDLLHKLSNNQNNVNNITNNLNMQNEELKAERISNKRSVVASTRVPISTTTNTMFVIDNNSAFDKGRITTINKKSPNVQVSLYSNNKSEVHSMGTEGKKDIYVVNKNDFNSTEVTTNNASHSDILKIPIGDSHHSTVPILGINQTSLNPNLNQTLPKTHIDLNNTYQSNHKAATNDHITKENLPVTSRVISKIKIIPTVARIKTNVGLKANKSSANTSLFRCNIGIRGRFADKNNCRKYYICIGNNIPVLGKCPSNTVFSEIKKQCTKNLSHCIRNNQFRCTQEGRFSDMLRSNIYYICVKSTNTYVRFTFQCQNGFHLNKTSVRCVKDIQYESQISTDSISNKGSDQSTGEVKYKEKKQVKEDTPLICSKEGKFPDGKDCRKYYVCTKSKEVYRRRTKKCDSDEVFHREKKKCVDRESYECI